MGARAWSRTTLAAGAATAGTLVLVALTTAGVLRDRGDDLPTTSFTLTNRTGGPLFHDGARMQRGSGLGIPVDGCSTVDLVVQDKTGHEVGRLDQWCAGQTWTVLGPARSRLDGRR